MDFKKSFIYKTIKAYESGKTFSRKRGSGKKCVLQCSQTRAKLKAEIVGRTAKSYRALANKNNMNDKTIKKYVADMGVMKCAKKIRSSCFRKTVAAH